MSEIFDIKPKKIFNVFGTDTNKTATKMLLRVLPYNLFSETVTAYVHFHNEANEVLVEGHNIVIDTPSDWGNDDQIVIDAFVKKLNVELI